MRLTSRRAPRPERPPPGVPEALEIAQRFLAARPRAAAEVRRRLARAGCAASVIDAALERLGRARLVDDAAFAAYWLDQRQTYQPRGARLLRAELRQRGIAADLAAQTAAASVETAGADAYRAAYRRASRLADLDADAFARRIGQFLARRGFDWDTISATVARLQRELSTSSDSAHAPSP